MSDTLPASGVSPLSRLDRTLRKSRFGSRFTLILIVLALLAGVATYVALTGSPILGGDPRIIIGLLLVDVVLVVALAVVVTARVISLWWARRSGLAGARLHVRLVTMFVAIAATPTVILGVASGLFFHLGVQAWFSERVQSAVRDSATIAQAYVQEHQKSIEADIRAMAYDIGRQAVLLDGHSDRFDRMVDAQANIRGLSEASVITSTGQVLARSALSFGADLADIPPEDLKRANQGEVVTIATEDDRVRALVRLDGFLDAYLLVGRFVDPRVIAYAEKTRAAVTEYAALESQRSGIQVTFAVIYVIVGLLVLFVAVLCGLWLSTRLVDPISDLVSATERVREGDLTARADPRETDDELSLLGHAFNRMTGQLQAQHGALVDANRQLDERRRFIEAVLSGVSAGVLGVDPAGRIVLTNQAAEYLLGFPEGQLIGQELGAAVPAMASLLDALREHPDETVQSQIHLSHDGRGRHFIVRMVSERAGRTKGGFVVTFDDISELVTAQRTAAWADVARRIAHEIKNPLTPIQLSAERLKRKYGREITSDPEVFNQCTETIIRQVGDIGRMVDEFSAFARMPAAHIQREDLVEQVKQAVFLRQVGHPEVDYVTSLPQYPVEAAFDRRQIGQALTNVLKNAAESIEARAEQEGAGWRGRIETEVAVEGRMIRVTIRDNGRGLPVEGRDRLTEPYVTTRAKGTGLGLAIVRKVMEEHGGTLELSDNPDSEGGAVVVLSLPVRSGQEPQADRSVKVIHGA